MRMKLAMDPDIVEKYLITGDYPTIRQIFDELFSHGNVDIYLFSNKSMHYVEQFIKRYNLDGLINQILLNNNEVPDLDVEVVADVRAPVLNSYTSVDISNGYTSLVEWFCPNSNLLDDKWCLINSSEFIKDMNETITRLDTTKVDKIKNLDGQEIKPDYLEIERVYLFLYDILKVDNQNMAKVGYEGFMAEREGNEYRFYYEG